VNSGNAEAALAGETIIWQYGSLAAFLSILQTQTLWFSRLDQLRDPSEGRSGMSIKAGSCKGQRKPDEGKNSSTAGRSTTRNQN
jgi:hypothetical protein